MVLCLVCFLPSFFFVAFKASSLAAGLLLSCCIVLVVSGREVWSAEYRKKSFVFSSWLFFFMILQSSYTYFILGDSKPIFSLFSLLIMVLSAISFSFHLKKMPHSELSGTLWVFTLLLLFIAWLKVFYSPEFFNYSMHSKAAFPFSEDSHLVLVAGFFFCVYAFFGGIYRCFFVFINMFLLSILYPSLLLFLFVFLLLFVLLMRVPPLMFKKVVLFVLPLVLFGVLAFANTVEYFASRLNFNDIHEVDNLTTLVFFQGWALAYLNLLETNGLGMGFQMLGSSETIVSSFTWSIMELASGGRALNLSDGGFLVAKVIAEFGILGLLVVGFYVFWLCKIPFVINRMHFCEKSSEADLRYVLGVAFIFSFLIEMFFRGYGYFSPSLFFVISAFPLLWGGHSGEDLDISRCENS